MERVNLCDQSAEHRKRRDIGTRRQVLNHELRELCEKVLLGCFTRRREDAKLGGRVSPRAAFRYAEGWFQISLRSAERDKCLLAQRRSRRHPTKPMRLRASALKSAQCSKNGRGRPPPICANTKHALDSHAPCHQPITAVDIIHPK